MENKINRLQNLDNTKLLDVIKNYKRYNYPEEFKIEALRILNERGFGEEAIQLSGGFSNVKYSDAKSAFNKFRRNGVLAIIFYLLSIFTYYGGNSIIYLILIVCFLVFVILTMNSRMQFFKVINEQDLDRSMIGYVLTFFISIPLFIIVYIIDRIELKGKLDQLP